MTSPAPAELEAHADATWGDRNIYALIITFGGAAVFHVTKKLALMNYSFDQDTEAIGQREINHLPTLLLHHCHRHYLRS